MKRFCKPFLFTVCFLNVLHLLIIHPGFLVRRTSNVKEPGVWGGAPPCVALCKQRNACHKLNMPRRNRNRNRREYDRHLGTHNPERAPTNNDILNNMNISTGGDRELARRSFGTFLQQHRQFVDIAMRAINWQGRHWTLQDLNRFLHLRSWNMPEELYEVLRNAHVEYIRSHDEGVVRRYITGHAHFELLRRQLSSRRRHIRSLEENIHPADYLRINALLNGHSNAEQGVDNRYHEDIAYLEEAASTTAVRPHEPGSNYFVPVSVVVSRTWDMNYADFVHDFPPHLTTGIQCSFCGRRGQQYHIELAYTSACARYVDMGNTGVVYLCNFCRSPNPFVACIHEWRWRLRTMYAQNYQQHLRSQVMFLRQISALPWTDHVLRQHVWAEIIFTGFEYRQVIYESANVANLNQLPLLDVRRHEIEALHMDGNLYDILGIPRPAPVEDANAALVNALEDGMVVEELIDIPPHAVEALLHLAQPPQNPPAIADELAQPEPVDVDFIYDNWEGPVPGELPPENPNPPQLDFLHPPVDHPVLLVVDRDQPDFDVVSVTSQESADVARRRVLRRPRDPMVPFHAYMDDYESIAFDHNSPPSISPIVQSPLPPVTVSQMDARIDDILIEDLDDADVPPELDLRVTPTSIMSEEDVVHQFPTDPHLNANLIGPPLISDIVIDERVGLEDHEDAPPVQRRRLDNGEERLHEPVERHLNLRTIDDYFDFLAGEMPEDVFLGRTHANANSYVSNHPQRLWHYEHVDLVLEHYRQNPVRLVNDDGTISEHYLVVPHYNPLGNGVETGPALNLEVWGAAFHEGSISAAQLVQIMEQDPRWEELFLHHRDVVIQLRYELAMGDRVSDSAVVEEMRHLRRRNRSLYYRTLIKSYFRHRYYTEPKLSHIFRDSDIN